MKDKIVDNHVQLYRSCHWMYRDRPVPRLERDEMFMVMAFTAAMRGTCNRLKVGAVLVQDNRPVSLGYNGTPPGHKHCGPECNADNPCRKTLHAEANAIDWAGTRNETTSGATLYITDSPCVQCARKIHLAGIKRVVYCRAYRDTSGLDYLNDCGVEIDSCHVRLVINAN